MVNLPPNIEQKTEHERVIDAMLKQLLIVMLKRLGGKLDVPVSEIDGTGQDLFLMSIDPKTRVFHFELSKKS